MIKISLHVPCQFISIGHLYVLTFYDSFWPLFLLSIIGIIMYVTNAGHQFCHSKLNHNFFQDTVDIVAICVLIEKMIKKKIISAYCPI